MTKRNIRRLRRLGVALLGLASFVCYLILNPDSYQAVIEGADFDALWGSVTPEALPELKTEQTEADSLLARDVLENLAVQEKDNSEKYYRKLFYDDWGTTASGCNTREAILLRDLKDTTLKGCKVQTGILEDPYTGKTIQFQRGQDTSSEVQIDHVVALSNAWATGAFALDKDTRYAISQDPLNLLAVDGPANQQKSDKDASDWLPSNEAFQCQYVARQISVKYKYKLWVTPREKLKMQEVLTNCPEETTVGLEKP